MFNLGIVRKPIPYKYIYSLLSLCMGNRHTLFIAKFVYGKSSYIKSKVKCVFPFHTSAVKAPTLCYTVVFSSKTLLFDEAAGVTEMGWGVVVSSVSRLSGCGVCAATKCFVTERFMTTFLWVKMFKNSGFCNFFNLYISYTMCG